MKVKQKTEEFAEKFIKEYDLQNLEEEIIIMIKMAFAQGYVEGYKDLGQIINNKGYPC